METEQSLKQLIGRLPKESLLPQEKEAMKLQVMRFMKEYPVQQPYWMHAMASFLNATPALRAVCLVAMVVLVGGGSVAFAAQHALPGDLLYPVKTGVTEKVLALTLFSNQAKAEYDINLTQLRLQEAEIIAAQNRLTAQSTQEVRTLLNDHIGDIQDRILLLKRKEDIRLRVELNAKLEAILKAHVDVIGGLAEKKQVDNSQALKDILADVKDKADKAAKLRLEDESRLDINIKVEESLLK